MPQTDTEPGDIRDLYNPFRIPNATQAKHMSSGYTFNQKENPVRMYNTSSSNHFAQDDPLMT